MKVNFDYISSISITANVSNLNEEFLQRCSSGRTPIYRRTPTPKCDFRTPSYKNTSGGLLLNVKEASIIALKKRFTLSSKNAP